MAESPRRSASGGRKGYRQHTHPPTDGHVIRRERPSRTRPCPDPCPAASGALQAVDGRPLADSCRLLDVR
jgi:hypothetical protein